MDWDPVLLPFEEPARDQESASINRGHRGAIASLTQCTRRGLDGSGDDLACCTELRSDEGGLGSMPSAVTPPDKDQVSVGETRCAPFSSRNEELADHVESEVFVKERDSSDWRLWGRLIAALKTTNHEELCPIWATDHLVAPARARERIA